MPATTPSSIQVTIPKISRTETGSYSFVDHVDSRKIIAAHYRRSALLSSCFASLMAMSDDPRALAEVLQALEDITKFHQESD